MDAPVPIPVTGVGFDIEAGTASHLVTFPVLLVSGSDPSIYGVRVAFDGTRLDPFPFPISTARGEQNWPEMAFNGTDWLVVWLDQRNDFTPEIYAARVASNGSVRDPNGIGVAVGSPTGIGSVASNGNGFIVTWNGAGPQPEGLQAAIVDADGTVARRFTVQSGQAFDSKIAFNGTHYLVGYNETISATSSLLRAQRFTPAGDTVGGIIDIGPASTEFELASDGSAFIAASHGTGGLDLRIIESDGSLGASGSLPGALAPASLTWGGSSYFLTASTADFHRLLLARIDTAAQPLRSEVVSVHAIATPKIAYGGGNAFVSFLPDDSSAHEVVGSRVDSTLALLDTPPVLLSSTGNWQSGVQAAHGKGGYLAVWADSRDGFFQTPVHAQWLSENGQPLDASSFPLSTEAGDVPDVASDGEGYLSVWVTGEEVRGTRVSAAGAVLDEPSIHIGTGSIPATASNGSDYYVAWRSQEGVRGARVLSDGRVSGGSVFSTARNELSVSSNGSNYLVAWSERGVKARRVDGAGTLLDATTPIDLGAAGANRLQVASDGTDWFVVWESIDGVRGARVLANGTVRDPGGRALDDITNARRTSVAWTGENYLLAWSRHEAADNAIYGRHISACGAMLEQMPFRIATEGPFDSSDLGGVTGNGSGRALVTYVWSDQAGSAARRARVRLVTGGGQSSDCGEGGEGGVGPGGQGGSDGDAGAGDAAGEGPGGSSAGGTSGRGSSGSSGTSAGDAGEGTGGTSGRERRGGRTIVTEGCGCRSAGVPTNRSGLLLALTVAFGTRRRRRATKGTC
jgi:MYXO-CTERM domain-containing protein